MLTCVSAEEEHNIFDNISMKRNWTTYNLTMMLFLPVLSNSLQ